MLSHFLLLWRSFDLLQESTQECHELPCKLCLITRNLEGILENPKNHRTQGGIGRLFNCKSGLMTKIAYSRGVLLKPLWLPMKFPMHVTIVSVGQIPSGTQAFYYVFQMQRVPSIEWKTSIRSPTIDTGPRPCPVFKQKDRVHLAT